MKSNANLFQSVPMYRDHPRPIRSVGNSISSPREQKEFLMFPKSFLNSHGSSLAAKAAIAVAAVAALGLLASTASASTIYSDSFPGSSSVTLNGTTPATDATGATWTADTAWSASGSVDESTTSGAWNAYLPFTPASGQIYTLSEGINATANAPGATNSWIGLAFLASGALGVPLYANSSGSGTNAAPLVIDYVPNSGVQIATFTLPGLNGANGYAYSGTGVQNLKMVLNTGGTNWTVSFSDNGTAFGQVYTYANGSNPTIADVGFGTSNASGQVSNFSLTSSPVPEPATLGLFAIGGAGLLLAARKRKTQV